MFQIWECGGNEEQWGTKDTYQLRTSNVLVVVVVVLIVFIIFNILL